MQPVTRTPGWVLSLALAGLVTLLSAASCGRQETRAQEEEIPDMNEPSHAGRVNAPEFPPGLPWLNTDKPLTLQQLRGKVVLLDFWTYC